ncbi:Protein translocase subunit SecA [Nymphon striatum]|nr:Protein translocase subunit SecA [Nymphon striatum]
MVNVRDPINGHQRHHNGIDIAAKIGTEINAIGSGFVTFAGRKGGYGNVVEIHHSDSLKSRYAHLNEILVNKGDVVRKADKIATMGKTGRATGSHLHLEVWENDRPTNPEAFIKVALKNLKKINMFGKVTKKLFGSRNDRLVKAYTKNTKIIAALDEEYSALSDEQLKAKTQEFRDRLKEGTTLEDLLPEAFATVREAGKRTMNMRHYDVQMIGGMVLNEGKIAEMRTGEGKTLVATLAAYLNALPGKGVHVITVNDYLARRDAEWMSRLYGFLGLSTGIIVNGMDQAQRQTAYASDITYGTNNEFGFDYLRDNMAHQKEDRVKTKKPSQFQVILRLKEKSKQIFLTDAGHLTAEKLLQEAGILPEGQGLYDSSSISVLHHFNAGLRAHNLFQKNVDYIVNDNEIVIVDEFTGRTMPGRRWSEGLHQAVEAKEGVHINAENQTMASITFQNYFRLYEKLCGMTGTADTEAFELQEIYGLEVVVIPGNKPLAREDSNDLVYMSEEEKYNAIAEEIEYCQKKGQPVLVGTASIETSEVLSDLLSKKKIKHEVLNAKQHEREASIIENAGQPGALTIATNMAGRGTDIVLGGSLEAELRELGEDATDAQKEAAKADWQKRHDAVIAAGGLHIIGTERHESRRIDNQLRGRAARQGDPGSSRFFLSLEDNLMRIFASDRVKAIMQRLGMEKGQAIEAKMVSKSIENAQRKVEGHNFDIRKNLLEYDDVANDQRKVIYEQRAELLEAADVEDSVDSFIEDVVETTIDTYIPRQSIDEQWDIEGLTKHLSEEMSVDLDIQGWLDADDDLHEETLRDKILESIQALIKEKEKLISSERMRELERDVMLHVVDTHWKEHLASMDYLRQSVGLRGYAQKNPKQEYKREAYEMFEELLGKIKTDVVTFLTRLEITVPEDLEAIEEEHGLQQEQDVDLDFVHADAESALGSSDPATDLPPPEAMKPFKRNVEKVGRNEPCPCGSVNLKPATSLKPVKGVRLSSLEANIRYKDRDDLTLIEVSEGSSVAGNANAGTGEEGMTSADLICAEVAEEGMSSLSSVLPFSTGVIGEQLPYWKIVDKIPELVESLDQDNWMRAAKAIMTTDTIHKGVTTDAAIKQSELEILCKDITTQSFNSISVDGDTSTNDSFVMMATGKSGVHLDDANREIITNALNEVCQELAQAIIRDAEGATKFVTVKVEKAPDYDYAKEIAYTVARSPLVKTALFASDPNWGRILAAIGRAPVEHINVSKLSLYLGETLLLESGEPAESYTEEQGQAEMNKEEITIRAVLNTGEAEAHVWTSDLSYDYVKINADYRS